MESEKKTITTIFASGRISMSMIIPINIARKHGLHEGANVIVESRPEGILIRRLDI